MRSLCRRESDFLFLVQRSAVAGRKFRSIQIKVAFDQLDPSVMLFFQRLANFSLGGEFADVKADILIDFDGFVDAIGRANQREGVGRCIGKRLLRIAGGKPFARRKQPNLEKVNRLTWRIINFTVRNARSRRNALHLASLHHRTVSHAVLVLERTTDDVTDDFEVTMRMRAETLAALNAVFIDHPQAAESDVLRVVIIRERKGVVTVQPAVIGMATFVGSANFNHGRIVWLANPSPGIYELLMQIYQNLRF